ncbi:MAG: SANT/Myb domain-containing protein [Holosporales bacterium]|nr:SANT/Myb domain-containing protein [Holosporales bacterium]
MIISGQIVTAGQYPLRAGTGVRWTEEDTDLLIGLVNRHIEQIGRPAWRLISWQFHNRTEDSCRRRFRYESKRQRLIRSVQRSLDPPEYNNRLFIMPTDTSDQVRLPGLSRGSHIGAPPVLQAEPRRDSERAPAETATAQDNRNW